ncbi:HAD family hydrolase [Lentibacillus sp. N15]|uniref:HAD family hydrolase n=1 Tax=Lentibacillus songyuanensis TaxID=3136161 RepID=UPI0031BAE996
MIKAVIFDLDGTLLHRDESVKIFINKQYDRLHKWMNHIPKDKYITRFIELDDGGYVWKDRVYQQLVRDFDIRGLTWEALLQDYMQQFQNSCVPFPNLFHMLERLKNKGLILGMITNGKGQFQTDNIRALGIEKYFDTILISEWAGIKKPDPRIFEKAFDYLHVLPSESIFIGDHPEKDVNAAKRVGMNGVWKKDNKWGVVQADYIVTDLKEIPYMVDKLNNQD